MDASAPQVLQLIEGSALALAIRQSVWVYPAANVGHVVAVAAFAAAVTVLDLILLGVIEPRGRARLLAATRRWTIALLCLVLATGAALFAAEASHVALNRVFQVKLVLIALAVLNGLWLGGRVMAAAMALPDAAALPGKARLAAALSLGLWLGVVALGRFIAYI